MAAVDTVKEMLTSQTDLDIILDLLSDHYGIDVLVLPENVDRLAVVTLANAVHDHNPCAGGTIERILDAAERRDDNMRKLARIVLDLMVDHGAEPAT